MLNYSTSSNTSSSASAFSNPALQHLLHTPRQDHSTSAHQKSHSLTFCSYHHLQRASEGAGPLVVSTSRTTCIRTLMLQCRLRRHVPLLPKLSSSTKMHSSLCLQRLLLHCNRSTTVCTSPGLLLHGPLIATPDTTVLTIMRNSKILPHLCACRLES